MLIVGFCGVLISFRKKLFEYYPYFCFQTIMDGCNMGLALVWVPGLVENIHL